MLSRLALIALTITLFASCEKGPEFREFSYPEQKVSSVYPTTGFPTQQLTITGSDFGNYTGPVKVYFNGVKASKIISCTDNQIVVEVPADALTGKVSLQVWNHKLDSVGSFSVLPLPVLESVTSKGIAPNIAQEGDEVWLTGKNFLTDASEVSINFNGTAATEIISATENLIKVKAPAGYTIGPVSISMMGLTLTGTSLAPSIMPGDVSGLFLKNYKQPFATNMTAAQSGTTSGLNWATAANWITNSAAQNQINSGATERCGGLNFGKSDARTTGQITLQAGWGDAIGNVMNNGKMFQTVSLPAGSYEFVAEVKEFGRNSNSHVYLVATTASDLPNTTDVSTSSQVLAYSEFTASQNYNATPAQKKISFTLTQPTTISLGITSTMVANTYLRLNSVSLILK